ncbi:MAG: ATP-binding protein, partial [Myxococcota bacterium]
MTVGLQMNAVIIGDAGWVPDAVRVAIEETTTNFEIVVVFGDPARQGADVLLTVGQARSNHPDAWLVAVVPPRAMHDALIAGANEIVSPQASVEEVKARLQRRLIYERTPEPGIGLPLPASARRLMTLGKVSTGLAHDFNNLLTVIMGNAAFLKEEADINDSSQRLIRALELSAMRASSLTEQILRYAGNGEGRLQPVDLNSVVKDTVPFLQALVTPTAELRLALADTLIEVRADRGGLHQLLVDLVQNAVEANDEIGSPVVVRTGVDKVTTGQHLEPRDTLAGRDAVFLEVEDHGHGMNPATVNQAFDPFFSTRGYGRGLGLSVVREVARSHSGAIEVDSQLGRGTRIRVWLPSVHTRKSRSVSSSAER